MVEASSSGLTRRQFLVGTAAGATAAWAAPRLGWVGRAGALPLDPATGAGDFGVLPFADSFDQAFPGGLLTHWNVNRPIQVVGMTPFGVPAPANQALDGSAFLAGHGMAVAMDGPIGTGNGPGRIETIETFLFRSDRTYTLSFDVAGSHHGADLWPATLVASLPGCGAEKTVTRSASEGFGRYHLSFRAQDTAASTIVFESGDGPGQAGLVLDNVALQEGDGSDGEGDGGD